jgi:hypothetical protein
VFDASSPQRSFSFESSSVCSSLRISSEVKSDDGAMFHSILDALPPKSSSIVQVITVHVIILHVITAHVPIPFAVNTEASIRVSIEKKLAYFIRKRRNNKIVLRNNP